MDVEKIPLSIAGKGLLIVIIATGIDYNLFKQFNYGKSIKT